MNLLVELVNSYYPEPHASLFNGMLLGKQLFVTRTFYEQLKDVGLIHIVVLSGMNITMLSAIVLNTLVHFINRKWALLCTIVIIIFFVLFVGAEPPIIRAAIMGIISLAAVLYGRKTMALYSLFLSGMIMLIINYEWIWSISFQLSFTATLGIILFGSMEENSKSQTSNVQRLTSYFLEELRISFAAQVFTIPLIFWYFRQISFVSPLANILVAWLIAPIMVLGMITIAAGMVSWHLGFVISWFVYPLLEFIVWVVEVLARVPFAAVRI